MKQFNQLPSVLCLLGIFILGFSNVNAQNMGIGVRFGDPTGLTFKKYNGNKALEFSFGRTHWINGNGWYNKHYNYWYDKNYVKYAEFEYINHRAYTPIGLQVHYLIHKDLQSKGDADLSGLKWYFGFGGTMGMQKYRYDYRYKVNGDPNWVYIDNETYTDLDLGADGVLGLEYTFADAPVSLFLDVTLYMELFDSPFLFGYFGGLGGRFNF